MSSSAAPVLTAIAGLVQPLFKNGKYANPFSTWQKQSLTSALKWQISGTRPTIPSVAELDERIPVLPLDQNIIQNPKQDRIQCTWIGHATMFVQMGGLNIITDPVFAERASPFAFAGPKRFRPTPCKIQDLPNIDYVLISHNHYDHLDYQCTRDIVTHHKNTRWFVPQGLKAWFETAKTGVLPTNITELSWWEHWQGADSNISVICTPSQHWSKRGAFDDFDSLWCSWIVKAHASDAQAASGRSEDDRVMASGSSSSSSASQPQSDGRSFFFTGDTGYCEAFAQIGQAHGPFDLAAIPIGAYEPRYFMKFAHVDPAEAVTLHQELRSKRSVAMHRGTFALADEPVFEPPALLREEAQKKALADQEFVDIKIGETIVV